MPLSPATHAPVTPVWQNPYVEVIRYGLAHHNVGYQQHGDVEQATDPQIHKNVFKIRGTIAATNYVRFPREISKSHQGLGLTGRYIYIQLRRARGQQATLHLDLLTTKKTALRVSLSSMYSSLRSAGTVLRIPLELGETWTTIAIDMAELLQFHTFNGYSRESYRYLKAVMCCASMNLRNIFTSCTHFTPETLPVNLSLPEVHENQCGPYVWLTLPDPSQRKPLQSPAKARRAMTPDIQNSGSGFSFNMAAKDAGANSSSSDEDDNGSEENATAVSPFVPPATPSKAPTVSPVLPIAPAKAVDTSGTGDLPLSPTSREAGLVRDRQDVLSRADQIMREAGFSVPSPRRTSTAVAPPHPRSGSVSVKKSGVQVSASAANSLLSPRRFLASEQSDWPDPIVSLSRIIGVSMAFPRSLRWLPDAHACIYTSHSTIVIREFRSEGGTPAAVPPSTALGTFEEDLATVTDDHETFLTDHTGPICALEIARDGAFLATAQNTPQCVLRLWDLRDRRDECVVVMKAPTKSIHVLAFARNGQSLCCVGSDDHARTQLFVWDCSGLVAPTGDGVAHAKKLTLRARQTCDFPISAIAFSPYEPDQLVSCGKENVRFWRLHATRHHLPGSPVILKEYSRGTVFTDLAFDGVYPQFPSNLPRTRPLYVSSSLGSVLVINYDTREVVCVYKLHDAAIHSLCVNEGFCVTGSDDKFLRVWPLDFSDFFLEAEHDAPVTSVDVSTDGLRVAVGTTSGAIGVLHLADQRYRSVLRSHTQPVHAMAALAGGALVTSAKDGTLRVWDVAAGAQRMEFDVSRDPVTCLAAMGSGMTIAVGFHSGCTRVFSLGCSSEAANAPIGEMASTPVQPRVEYEFQQHQSVLCDVLYQSDDAMLYTSGAGQQICLYDVAQAYAPIKMLIADMDTTHGKLCLSRDGRFLAVLQHGRRSVLLLDAASLCVVSVLTPPGPPVTMTTTSTSDELELTQLVISWNSQELLAVSRADRLYVFSLAEQQDSNSSKSGGRGFGGLLHSMPLLGQQGITSFTVSPNLKYMATGGSDGSLRVWQCELGKHKFQRMHQTFVMNAGEGKVCGVAFASNGDHVLAVSDSSSAVFVWRFRGNTSKLPALELVGSRLNARQAASKADFQLPLDDISHKKDTRLVDAQPPQSSGKVSDIHTEVETVQLRLSTKRCVDATWKHVLPAQTQTATPGASALSTSTPSASPCHAWSSALGCLIFTVDCGRVVVVERLDSGVQSFVSIGVAVERVTLSPSQQTLLIVPVLMDAVLVCDLVSVCRENNQREDDDQPHPVAEEINATRIELPYQLEKLYAVELSMDGKLLCVSGDTSKTATAATDAENVLFVVDIESRGTVVWHVSVPPSGGGISSIVSQSPREFLCIQHGVARPLHRLRLPPFSVSSPAVKLTLDAVLHTHLPSPAKLFSCRDDGDTPSSSVRCRFAVAIDSDAYCVFVDLDQQQLLLTTQLLMPSHVAGAKLASVQWIGTSDWQALVATLEDGQSLAVFPLPTKFAFSKHSHTRVAVVDWGAIRQSGRLCCGHMISFESQRIAREFVDPMNDVGLVLTQDGAAVVVQFRTAQKRTLRVATAQRMPMQGAVLPQIAAKRTMLLTLSLDRHAIQCWESTTGRELTRLYVASTKCTVFTVSPFDSTVVVAGYDDGSIRIFHVGDQRLVAQCVLPPPPAATTAAASSASRLRAPPRSVEALSLLKKKQSHAVAEVMKNETGGFQELRFLGPRCVLAVTKALWPVSSGSSSGGSSSGKRSSDATTATAMAQRLVLLDFSEVPFAIPVATGPASASAVADQPPPVKRKQRGSGIVVKATLKDKVAIHYRELALPPVTQGMWQLAHSDGNGNGSDIGATPATRDPPFEIRIESLDVQPSSITSASATTSPVVQERSGQHTTPAPTNAFLVVATMSSRIRHPNSSTDGGRGVRIAYVFDGSGDVAGSSPQQQQQQHPVFATSPTHALKPVDLWILPKANTASSVVFDPSESSHILYTSVAAAGQDRGTIATASLRSWAIHVRDFRRRCPVVRLELPVEIQASPLLLKRSRVGGRRLVVVSSTTTNTAEKGRSLFAVDLSKRVVIPVQSIGDGSTSSPSSLDEAFGFFLVSLPDSCSGGHVALGELVIRST